MGSGFQEIRLSTFVPAAENFPILKGKAAEVASLIKPLLALWLEAMDSSIRVHRMVRLCLTAIDEMEDVLGRNRTAFRLRGEAATCFRTQCYNLAAFVTALGTHYHVRGLFLFNYTIKLHYILHIGNECEQINPRIGWCYAGEDMMLRVKILAQSCYSGVPLHRLGDKILSKYIIGLSYQAAGRFWR